MFAPPEKAAASRIAAASISNTMLDIFFHMVNTNSTGIELRDESGDEVKYWSLFDGVCVAMNDEPTRQRYEHGTMVSQFAMGHVLLVGVVVLNLTQSMRWRAVSPAIFEYRLKCKLRSRISLN